MTKYQKQRNTLANKYLANANDDGRFGRAFELECASAYSRKSRVGLNGEKDVYIHFEKGNVPAECKTNGGRIASLLADNAPKFVIYRYRYVAKLKGGDEVREIDPVIIPTEVFISRLIEFNAIKSTNGKNPEPAIQVSNKKFFEWLLDWPIPYTPGTHYTADDFEGLE